MPRPALVVDASVTAAWFFPDERPETAATAYDVMLAGGAAVPWIWWFEVRNAFVVGERRGRFTRQQCDDALALLERHPIALDAAPSETDVLRLARANGLTVYDAAYLELALRFDVPLATLDGRLAAAARSEGAALVGE